jgi:hypothetical protein
MTTPVIIDDKYVSVNAVSFGAHFVSWIKKNCTHKYVLKNITCIWQAKWIKFFKSMNRYVSVQTWHHHITERFELKRSAIPILAVSFVLMNALYQGQNYTGQWRWKISLQRA